MKRWYGGAARTQVGRGIIGYRRSSAFWGLRCPKTHHEIEDTLVLLTFFDRAKGRAHSLVRRTGEEFQQSDERHPCRALEVPGKDDSRFDGISVGHVYNQCFSVRA